MNSRKLCFIVSDLQFFLTHRLDLAKKLSKNYEIHLACDIKNASTKHLQMIERDQIIIHHLKSRDGTKFFKDFIAYFLRMKRLLESISPSYILFVTLEISFIGALIHHFMGNRKSLFLITGLGRYFAEKTFKYQVIQIVQRIVFSILSYKKNILFIFQNPDDLNTFINLGMVAKSNTILIKGNGINVKYFYYIKREFKPELVFLFASRLVKSKGINEFISAASIVKKRHPSAKFLVAGRYNNLDPDTINDSEYQNLISSEYISYLGELPHTEMQKYFHTSSIFVMPSYGEGLPKVALEAAATGMPLIMTNVQGCRECVKANKNGYLIKPKDSNDLAQTMESCILNINNMDAYGKISSAMVKENFSLELISKEFEKVLN